MTFIATQSIPTVSSRPSSSAIFSFVPTPSVESAIPVRSSIRLVERDRALWPYAAYRAALAAVVLVKLREGMSQDAYARAGVDQGAADSAVAGLVRALGAIQLDRPSAQVPLPGHYASVIRIDERTGIALSTDGVGTKLKIAEELGRLDTVGIDCVAMNVNDVICVGAEPLAMLDYIAIDRANPEVCEQIGIGLARGATLAGIEIPGGELAQLGDMVHGVDVSGACFGTVALDAIVDGSAVAPATRDRAAFLGPALERVHAGPPALDGSTSATSASAGRSARSCWSRPRSTSSRSSSCCAPTIEVRGLAHITSGGLDNLLRLGAGSATRSTRRCQRRRSSS